MAKFAVLVKQAPVGISADEYRRRLPTGVAYMKGLIDKGIVAHAWARVGASGGLFVLDVDSHAELLTALYDNPISAHLDFEVSALVDFADFDGQFASTPRD
ncbi:MAG TPA: muconolactone Delta-isomerase family protein [Pseudonocardiaceae bacterium]